MKRKFVKVMLFGALTLAVSTTITSCIEHRQKTAENLVRSKKARSKEKF